MKNKNVIISLIIVYIILIICLISILIIGLNGKFDFNLNIGISEKENIILDEKYDTSNIEINSEFRKYNF